MDEHKVELGCCSQGTLSAVLSLGSAVTGQGQEIRRKKAHRASVVGALISTSDTALELSVI